MCNPDKVNRYQKLCARYKETYQGPDTHHAKLLERFAKEIEDTLEKQMNYLAARKRAMSKLTNEEQEMLGVK